MCKFGPLWLIDMRPRQRVGICLCDLQDLGLYLFMIEVYLKGKMQGDPSIWCPHFANLHLILQHYKSPWNGTPKQVAAVQANHTVAFVSVPVCSFMSGLSDGHKPNWRHCGPYAFTVCLSQSRFTDARMAAHKTAYWDTHEECNCLSCNGKHSFQPFVTVVLDRCSVMHQLASPSLTLCDPKPALFGGSSSRR